MMTRDEFCKLLPQTGVGIELGVAGGRNLERILRNTNLRMWGVDLWEGDRGAKEWLQAREVEARFDERVRLALMDARTFRETFRDVCALDPFDLIYVDLFAHEGNKLRDVLELWYPTLASNGVMAGDDYYRTDFPAVCEAVDAFAKGRGLTVKSFEIEKDPSDVYSQHPQWVLGRN